MSWLTDVALDGILGAVLGGAATGGAVWWTLPDQRGVTARRAAITAVVRLQTTTGALTLRLEDTKGMDDIRAAMLEVSAAAVEARARIYHRWRTESDALGDLVIELGETEARSIKVLTVAMQAKCEEIIKACGSWLKANG